MSSPVARTAFRPPSMLAAALACALVAVAPLALWAAPAGAAPTGTAAPAGTAATAAPAAAPAGPAATAAPAAPAGAAAPAAACAPDAQAKMKAEMEAYAKLAQPGEHHKHLGHLAGKWKVTGKAWMAPGQPPVEIHGTMEASWILGGRYLQELHQGAFMASRSRAGRWTATTTRPTSTSAPGSTPWAPAS
jgi:Protein of unknown function (DUF1579)